MTLLEVCRELMTHGEIDYERSLKSLVEICSALGQPCGCKVRESCRSNTTCPPFDSTASTMINTAFEVYRNSPCLAKACVQILAASNLEAEVSQRSQILH
mmetsp:Transcript_34461/g.54896  ORF Transcript_34461/g.54896 Transcript_34461/m.54896 type:complete len:100 (+) Transcript_34461:280-579(+)